MPVYLNLQRKPVSNMKQFNDIHMKKRKNLYLRISKLKPRKNTLPLKQNDFVNAVYIFLFEILTLKTVNLA